MTDRQTALVVGAGTGLGAALARCFAGSGMNVAVAARDPDRLSALVETLNAEGAKAVAVACDATDEGSVRALFDQMNESPGEPDVVVYNAGAFVPGSILDIAPEEFERCWRIGCFGGFLVGQAAARRMVARAERGDAGGTIVFSGATASLRGGARFANLAVGKFGLRALAQSMARELGPRGVHVAHVIIDGMIAAGNSGEQAPADSRLEPDAIAANYLVLHHQPRSAWTHELDLRPWMEKF